MDNKKVQLDLQKLFDALSDSNQKRRSEYHLTLGALIEKLKDANKSARINPEIVGICAYRGYYSDIALCTINGTSAYKKPFNYEELYEDPKTRTCWSIEKWEKENEIKINVINKNPHELAEILESLLDSYLDGYKGGSHMITREKPLWLASDYSNCSNNAIVGIDNNLKLELKKIM